MAVVRWLACDEGEPDPSASWLSARDRRRLEAMAYTKRFDEARLSRWTAHRAVALSVGLGDAVEALGRVEIFNEADGSPRARAPGAGALSISSTDRAGWAVTTVLQGEAPIGCDLELVEPRSPAFVRDYFTEREQKLVAAAPLPSDVTANLIWSAKESALKVLRTGLRKDTRSVEVDLEPTGGDGWRPLTVTHASETMSGWWRRYGAFLLTFASASAHPPPKSLVEPSPLEGAEPAHSWLGRPLR